MFAYPPEFRREYRSQLFLDFEDNASQRVYLLRLLFEMFFTGISMRVELLWRDVTYAVRTLVKARLFTLVVVGTLAVAIAANVIVFSALEAVLLKPLPYADFDRLAFISARTHSPGGPEMTMTLPASFAQVLKERSRCITGAAVIVGSDIKVRVDGRIENLRRALINDSYFSTLGIAPYLGRFLSAGPKGASQAVISYPYWRSHYDSDRAAIGKILTIENKAYTIVGVAPAGTVDPFLGTVMHDDVWTLIPQTKGDAITAFPVVRMRPGTTPAQLQADVTRLWRFESSRRPFAFDSMERLHTESLREALFANTGLIWILFGAVVAVLLIACANIANLMLVRGAARETEFRTRAALGASRGRIATQNLVETLVLCTFGSGIGLGLAAALMRPVIALIPGNLPRLEAARIDGHVIFYVILLAIAVTLVSGIVPALRASGKNLGGRRSVRTRTALVAIEVCAAFALLACSGLLLRSFMTLEAQPAGFDAGNVYVASFIPQWIEDAVGEQHSAAPETANRIAQQVRVLPGVSDVAIATAVPFTIAFNMIGEFRLEGEGQPNPQRPDPTHMSSATNVSPEFFRLMRIPVLRGRSFTAADASSNAVVVNRAFVKAFFKNKPALGSRLFGSDGTVRVVGIVGDTRNSLALEPKPMLYLPTNGKLQLFQIVVKTKRPDSRLATEIASIAHRLYPQIGTPRVDSLEDALAQSSASARASFLLLGALTVVAVLLAFAGIYGIVAFSVEQRYHEIGIRLALGASNADTFRRTVSAAVVQSLVGIAFGIIAAALAANAIQTQLYRVSPLDPGMFAATVALLVGCSAIAAAVPAWRAMRIDPARTLRYE